MLFSSAGAERIPSMARFHAAFASLVGATLLFAFAHDQIEALGPLGPVHRCNVHQIIEVRFELQVLQHRDDAIGRGHDEILPEVGGRLLHAIAEPLLQVARQIAVPGGSHHDGGRFGRRRRGGFGRGGFRGGRNGSGWLYRRLHGLILRGKRPLGALWFLLVGHSLSSRESYTYHLRRWGVKPGGAAVSPQLSAISQSPPASP